MRFSRLVIRLAIAISWQATIVLTACSRQPTLQQPVGNTHVSTPPPVLASNKSDKDQARERKSEAAGTDPNIYYRLCDLPDTRTQGPHFPTDSAVLGPYGKQVLDQVANCMLRGSLLRESVIVLGYADPRGADEYNLELAMARARAVARYLVNRGVPAQRVSVASRGGQYNKSKKKQNK